MDRKTSTMLLVLVRYGCHLYYCPYSYTYRLVYRKLSGDTTHSDFFTLKEAFEELIWMCPTSQLYALDRDALLSELIH